MEKRLATDEMIGVRIPVRPLFINFECLRFVNKINSSTHTAIRWAKLDTIPAAGSRMLETMSGWPIG